MSKFKVKLKVTGLELEIEGSREDASMLSRNVSSQLAGLMRPLESVPVAGSAEPAIRDVTPSKKHRKTRRSSNIKEEHAEPEISFTYNQEVHGVPDQNWKTADKALWLLSILKKSENLEEATSRQIVDVFQTHFRQFGAITTSNVTRDLTRFRKESPSPIGQNTNREPPSFYLTAEGLKRADKLAATPTEG